ncbi:protein of unknown function (plasmid) [Candidatus Methylocalor cossyra]|uniref:Uncharacterized protein n=1 Tax=Candidatus Methylocalor cossyra TaxID=3108543 RepID=A0ABM9NN78_9GAMM
MRSEGESHSVDYGQYRIRAIRCALVGCECRFGLAGLQRQTIRELGSGERAFQPRGTQP